MHNAQDLEDIAEQMIAHLEVHTLRGKINRDWPPLPGRDTGVCPEEEHRGEEAALKYAWRHPAFVQGHNHEVRPMCLSSTSVSMHHVCDLFLCMIPYMYIYIYI